MSINRSVKGLTKVTALALMPVVLHAEGGNYGPYVGGGVGYNKVGDQTFDFRGTHTSPTQPTVPVELQPVQNDGVASENSYKGSYAIQATGGYRFENGFRPEVELGYRTNDAKDVSYPDPDASNLTGTGQQSSGSNVKLVQTSIMFNLWYDLFPSSRLHPYLGGGVGIDSFSLNKQPTNQLTHGVVTNSTTDDTNPGPPLCTAEECGGPRKATDQRLAYQGGAGVRWDMTGSMTVGLDYRYIKAQKAKFYSFKDQQETHLDSDYDAQTLFLSLNYFFGRPTAPPPPAEAAPVVVAPPVSVCSDGQDNDGDGKVDYPADPGCSAADDSDETDPPICSNGKDDDGDGLTDFPSDKGCSSADDNDETDPCKSPAPGERITLKGCGTGDVIVLRGVNFDFDKATLTANAKTILDNVGEELVAYPEIAVEVGGHTDAKGSDSYNQKLSDRRAASVVKYLESKGVANGRMISVGYGEAQPVADNETDEGRELNRRVELKVTAGTAGGDAAVAGASAPAPDSTAPAAEAAPAAQEGEGSTPP